jgi:hypothetical protein
LHDLADVGERLVKRPAARRGRWMTVPEPRRRAISPSACSARKASRTVKRLTL